MAGKHRRVVICTWGSLGDLHPYLAIALELERRGHRPVIATMEGYRGRIMGLGLSFHPVPPHLPPPGESREVLSRALDVRRGPAYLIREIVLGNLRDAYRATLQAVTCGGGADVIVSHPITLAAPIVAERTHIPWISTDLAPGTIVSAFDPPTPAPLPALRNLIAWHPTAARLAIALVKLGLRPWSAPIHRLRAELGLPRSEDPLFEGRHSSSLGLALFSPELAGRKPDYPPNTRITGFPFYDAAPEPAAHARLSRFLAAGEPPILFTLGSTAVWAAGEFYRTSVAAARRLGKRALLLAGDRRNLPAGKLPTDVAAFDYLPYHLVMPHASCIVHQGGIGTTGQALRAGRPMLIVPSGYDTPDNARRCVELGVGRMLPRHRYTVDSVERALSEILDRHGLARRAQEVGRRVSAESGTANACDAIEELLAAKASPRHGLV